MVWIPLLLSHLLHRFWHLWGGQNTISRIFLLSRLFGTWSSPWGFFVHIPKKIPGLLVCNARKWEQSHQTAINFPSDGRLGPVLLLEWKRQGLCHGGANLVDLTFLKNYTKNKEVSRAWTVQWYGFRLCRCISFIASDTYGADVTRSLAFSYCLVSTEHDLGHGGFLSAFQQKFSWPPCV